MSSLCGVDAGLKVRGVGLREARRVYHDALRGTSKSEREEAFLEAFRELRPYGRKGDWPGRATTGIPKAESGRIVTEVERDRQLRCLSYGGSFRRVDSGRSPGARSREEDLQPDQLSSAGTSYKHTLDPNLSGSTDLLSLIRNSVVGLLASMGLVVELTFSNDFRYIYALISASEAVLEELAKKHDYPVAADLAQVDPEAAEPCDRCFEPLRPRDPEASELLKELGLEEGAAQRAQGPLEDSQREAFSWYLRSRLKGRSALAALREANAAWPGGKEGLLNTWDRLLGQRGLEVLRVDPDTQGRFLREVEVQRLDGQKVSSHFCREDRTVLIMAAMSDACDIFNLMRDGYVADVLPCTGEREEDIHLAWRRHISSWLLVPALLGILAQVAFVFAEDWQAEVLLGYVLSVSLWCGAALSAWTLKVRRLLLSRGCVTRPCEKPESRRQFHGTLKRSLLTGEMEEQVSSSLGYIARQALSILLCLILAVASVLVYTPRSAPYDLPLTLPWSDSDEDFQTASEESPAPSQWLAPALDPGGLLPPWNAQRFRFWKVHMMAARSGGQVELHLDLMTGGTVAVKHVPRSRLRESPQAYQEAWPGEVENPWKEIEILSRFGLGPDQLPGVCRSFGSFRTECGDGMLVCEYLPGGDLFDIAAKLGEPGPEREQQIYPIFYSLVQAVRALHLRGIAHGDLSLENALVRGSQVVLIDFAMAVTDHVDHATGHRGKPSYMAPEMFSQRREICEQDAHREWLLSDPQVLTDGASYDFGRGDLGLKGMQMFFKSHKCNYLCKKLGLRDIGEFKEPTLRCYLPGSTNILGGLHGKEGHVVKEIRQKSGVSRVLLPREAYSEWMTVNIYATSVSQANRAIALIKDKVDELTRSYGLTVEVPGNSVACSWNAAYWRSKRVEWIDKSGGAQIALYRGGWMSEPQPEEGMVNRIYIFPKMVEAGKGQMGASNRERDLAESLIRMDVLGESAAQQEKKSLDGEELAKSIQEFVRKSGGQCRLSAVLTQFSKEFPDKSQIGVNRFKTFVLNFRHLLSFQDDKVTLPAAAPAIPEPQLRQENRLDDVTSVRALDWLGGTRWKEGDYHAEYLVQFQSPNRAGAFTVTKRTQTRAAYGVALHWDDKMKRVWYGEKWKWYLSNLTEDSMYWADRQGNTAYVWHRIKESAKAKARSEKAASAGRGWARRKVDLGTARA
ncbi:unnamed protein product [Effrenium voratum]|nr:unnamed protein product [Effrenium voratum]